jgi:hypothetical protein
MEKIKINIFIYLCLAVPIVSILPALLFVYDREYFPYITLFVIMLTGRVFYKIFFSKDANSRGCFINEKGIIIDKIKIFEWNKMIIVEKQDHWFFGREIVIKHATDVEMENICLGLILIQKDSFISQLKKYAPEKHVLTIAVEKHYSSKR